VTKRAPAKRIAPDGGGVTVEEDFDKRDWLNYVATLSQRELQRSTANGYTRWGLYAAAAFLLWSIIGSADSVTSLALERNLLNDVTMMTDLAVGISYLGGQLSLQPTKVRRLMPGVLSDHPLLGSVSVLATFAFLAVLNLAGALFTEQGWYLLPFVIFLAVAVLNSKRTLVHEARATSLEVLLWVTLAIIGSAIVVVVLSLQHNLMGGSQTVRAAMYIVGLLIVFRFIIDTAVTAQRREWLEAFEQRIITEQLSVAEIRDQFLEGYAGVDVPRWLESRLTQVVSCSKAIMNLVAIAPEDLAERVAISIANFENTARDLKQFLTEGRLTPDETAIARSTLSQLQDQYADAVSLSQALEPSAREEVKPALDVLFTFVAQLGSALEPSEELIHLD